MPTSDDPPLVGPSPASPGQGLSGYTYVTYEGQDWPTLAGRWHKCPKHNRLLTWREFAYGSSGMCSWCRPDLLPYVPRVRAAAKSGIKRTKKG